MRKVVPRFTIDRAQQVENAVGRLGVEISRGFVGENEGRLHRQRTGDRHALLLTARQVAGHVLFPWPEIDLVEQLSAVLVIAASGQPRLASSGISTFSAAVNSGSRQLYWKTKPIERPRSQVRSRSFSFRVSLPSIDDLATRSGNPVVRSGCSSVLLPEPDGPMSAVNSPRSRTRLMPWSTSSSTGVPVA